MNDDHVQYSDITFQVTEKITIKLVLLLIDGTNEVKGDNLNVYTGEAKL